MSKKRKEEDERESNERIQTRIYEVASGILLIPLSNSTGVARQLWPAYSADAVTCHCSQTRYPTGLRYNSRTSQQPWRRRLSLQQHRVAAFACGDLQMC